MLDWASSASRACIALTHCNCLLWAMQVFSLHVPTWWQCISLWDAGCGGILCHSRGSIVYSIIRHSIMRVVTSLQQINYLSQKKDSQQHAYLWKCYLLPKYHVSMSRRAAVAAKVSHSCQFPSVPQEGNVALCKAGQPRAAFPSSLAILWEMGRVFPHLQKH